MHHIVECTILYKNRNKDNIYENLAKDYPCTAANLYKLNNFRIHKTGGHK